MSLSSKEVVKKKNGWARGMHLASRIKHLESLGNHRFTAVSILFLHGCDQTLVSMSAMSGIRLGIGGDLVIPFHRQ